MSRIQEHLEQWAHNRRFISTIQPDFPDWIVTVAFYTATHAIESLLTAGSAKPRSRHSDRLEILQRERRYQKIYERYWLLYEICHVTRYSAQPDRWYPRDQIKKDVIEGMVYPIETSVRKLLAASNPSVVMAEHSVIELAGPLKTTA